jgi:hypothetical protein
MSMTQENTQEQTSGLKKAWTTVAPHAKAVMNGAQGTFGITTVLAAGLETLREGIGALVVDTSLAYQYGAQAIVAGAVCAAGAKLFAGAARQSNELPKKTAIASLFGGVAAMTLMGQLTEGYMQTKPEQNSTEYGIISTVNSITHPFR